MTYLEPRRLAAADPRHSMSVYLESLEYVTATEQWSAAIDEFHQRNADRSLSETERAELWQRIDQCPSQHVKSERHPEHQFSRRYLCSPYNGDGFNKVVPELTSTDHNLEWVFAPLGRDWGRDLGWLTLSDVRALVQCRGRAEQVAVELRASDGLRVTTVSMSLSELDHMWTAPPGPGQVLAWARRELQDPEGQRMARHGGGYTTPRGTVYPATAGLPILALTPGRDLVGRPAAIAVYQLDPQRVEHFIHAAEIVSEFCDEAIALVENDGAARITWNR